MEGEAICDHDEVNKWLSWWQQQVITGSDPSISVDVVARRSRTSLDQRLSLVLSIIGIGNEDHQERTASNERSDL